MLTPLMMQFKRLRGTLTLPLVVIAPLLTAIVTIVIAARLPESDWAKLMLNAFALWTYFVLPLSTAALTALLAQVEHGPRTWDHLLALPVARSRLLGSMAISAALLTGAMNLFLVAFLTAGGSILGEMIFAKQPGVFPYLYAVSLVGLTWVASLLMTSIQLWVALTFRSFVVPIILGLAGTFIVVASMGGPEAALLPWGMPLGALPTGKQDPTIALLLGGAGGLAILPFMLLHLCKREFR